MTEGQSPFLRFQTFRKVCNNPYCESKPNWFGNFALCTKCLHEAADVFVMKRLLEKSLSNIKEGSE